MSFSSNNKVKRIPDLFRFHYDQLVVVVSDAATCDGGSIEWSWTGWSGPFQGGQNVHSPSDFVFLYAKADEETPAKERIGLIHVVHDKWLQDRNRERDCWYSFDPGILLGMNEETIVDFLLRIDNFWSMPEEDWAKFSPVNKKDVDNYVQTLSDKSISHVRESYGQGGDFFKV